jgi:DNA polymerase-3 subunit delta
LDGVLDAAFAGRIADVESELAKARAASTAPGTLISAALRHVSQLHRARLALDRRAPIEDAVRTVCGQNFRRRPLVEAALKSWSSERFERAMLRIAEAVFTARVHANVAAPLVEKLFFDLAVEARTQKK